MKRVLVVASLAGCASGQSNQGVIDADVGQPGVDAKVYLDSGIIEPQPDAPKPPADASIDAPKPPPDAYVCTVKTMQLLVNPALDTTGGWVQQNIDNAYPIITNTGVLAPHSAPNKAWMGGITGDDIGAASATDVMYQDVAVPAGTTQLVVTLQYDVRTSETGTTVYDRADVSLLKTDGTPLESVIQLTNATPKTAWTALSKTFTGNYSGQTVRLRFTSTNDIISATSFYFDTFALTATYCQ
jgi:hypothetical protein